MFVNRDARRFLYQSLVKSQVSFATEVWSPSECNIKIILERIQRRETRWILKVKKGDISFKDRLLALNFLPLAYDREIKDLMYFFRALCD